MTLPGAQTTAANPARDPARLIVVSNREPYEHRRLKGDTHCQRTDGGLAAALDPVLRRLGGTWVAWGSGEADREAVGADDVVRVPPESPAYRLRRVWLTTEEVKNGYVGYANQVLWPLCHITLDRVDYRKAFWEAYRGVNRRFAEAVLAERRERPGPIWVHDFHLTLLPAMIREAAPGAVVALFWHVPWPGPDVFRILPERREVLQGLLAADSLVFQTGDSARAFVDCAQQFLGAEAAPAWDAVRYNGHRSSVTVRPISVDYQHLSGLAQTTQVQRAMAVARKQLGLTSAVRLGLGVDRLDYTKGLLKRFWALDAFFTRYPHYRGAMTFLQIAVPTRNEVEAYRRYREVLKETVFEINERHGREPHEGARGWRPIELQEGRIGLNTLSAYYRMADFALVSSVYDGMNLVAKEYVASQVDEQGVLLISQMAGSAEELTDAVIINPYDLEGLADAVKQALEMPADARRLRMRLMRAYLKAHDVHAWVDGCLGDAGVPVVTRAA